MIIFDLTSIRTNAAAVALLQYAQPIRFGGQKGHRKILGVRSPIRTLTAWSSGWSSQESMCSNFTVYNFVWIWGTRTPCQRTYLKFKLHFFEIKHAHTQLDRPTPKWHAEMICRCPKMGVLQNHWIYFQIFHYKPSSYWCTPIYGNLHMLCDTFLAIAVAFCTEDFWQTVSHRTAMKLSRRSSLLFIVSATWQKTWVIFWQYLQMKIGSRGIQVAVACIILGQAG